MGLRLAVVGSRTFNNYSRVCRVLDGIYAPIDAIVSGGAAGADSLAARYAKENGIRLVVFLPNWSLGRGAALARNQLIVDNSDAMVAFQIAESRGTADSIRRARERGIPICVVRGEDMPEWA